MALVTKVFDALSNKLQKLQFSPIKSNIPVDENSSSSFFDHFTRKKENKEIYPIQVPLSQTLDVDILGNKINELKNKLKKKQFNLHVFNHTDIQYGPTLGQGSEGVVQRCKVQYNDFQIDAAVKTVLNSTEDVLDVTLHEIELLCLANDPIMSTVIQVYGVAAVPMKHNPTRGHLVIVTEIGLQNLLNLYQTESIPLHVTLKLWHDLSIAIHCMHCKDIIHQDLKPENVLVTSITRDSCGSLLKVKMKVIDLGMSMMVDREKGGRIVTDDIPGTLGYHAPEVLFDDSYDFKADIFVLAVVFCVMLLPRSTLQSSHSLEFFLKKIHTGKEQGLKGASLFFSVMQPHLDKHHAIPTSLLHLICKMLERADEREVNLLSIASICNNEASNLAKHCPVPPVPSNNDDSRDSGLMSDSCKYYLRGKRVLSGEDDSDDDDDDDNGGGGGGAGERLVDDEKRHFKDCFNESIVKDDDGDSITKLRYDNDQDGDEGSDTQEYLKEDYEYKRIVVNDDDDDDDDDDEVVVGGGSGTLMERLSDNNVRTRNHAGNNSKNNNTNKENNHKKVVSDNNNNQKINNDKVKTDMGSSLSSSGEKSDVRFLKTRSRSFKMASSRKCKRSKLCHDAQTSVIVEEKMDKKEDVVREEVRGGCQVTRRSSIRTKTQRDLCPYSLKRILGNPKDVTSNMEAESGLERSLSRLRNRPASMQQQQVVDNSETIFRTPSRPLRRSNTMLSRIKTADLNVLDERLTSSPRRSARRSLNKSALNNSISNNKTIKITLAEDSDMEITSNADARDTRATHQRKALFSRVGLDCDRVDKEGESGKKVYNCDVDNNILSCNNANLGYVSRKLAKIKLMKNQNKVVQTNSRIDVMKLTYDVSTDNLIKDDEGLDKENPLTRSALKRTRQR